MRGLIYLPVNYALTCQQSSILVGITHHLVGASEIGAMLGISRQRVDQIVRTDKRFPEPEATIGRRVRVWSRHAIEKWAKETGRTIVGQ